MKWDLPGQKDYFFASGVKGWRSARRFSFRQWSMNTPPQCCGSKELDEFPALCFRSLCPGEALLFNLDHSPPPFIPVLNLNIWLFMSSHPCVFINIIFCTFCSRFVIGQFFLPIFKFSVMVSGFCGLCVYKLQRCWIENSDVSNYILHILNITVSSQLHYEDLFELFFLSFFMLLANVIGNF